MEKQINTQNTLFEEALNLVKTPIIIALVLTPVRYILELFGLPEKFIFIIGLLWLTIGISVYWGIRFHNKKRFLTLLLLSLVIYSPISRFPVALAWWIDTKWQLGTHYGLYFNNFGQAVLNQVVYGSLIQILPGFLTGSITFAILQHRQTLKLKSRITNNG
ncbi:hypothetical protein LCM02_02595 [Lutimonas saemankumensis]|uniref:hypothetical protein n=1 Tax=Lutimonas saemankumensis TaxID=483016 RepID=UPI001CD818B5|nr:hypothetical protein [Lutimonas saemankumensis]MCA0931324.1 hypothetical protein [Lutimonas saemankumensis]